MNLIQPQLPSDAHPEWRPESRYNLPFNVRNLGLVLLLMSLLAGCGQRGPLYLPDEPPPGNTPGQTVGTVDPLEEELEEQDDLEGGNLEDEDIDGV